MKITDVRSTLLTGPSTNDPFFLEIRQRRSAAFIEVVTDAGIIGIGETYAGYFCPEVVPSIVEAFKPILINRRIDDNIEARVWVQAAWDDMYRCENFWCRVGLGAIVLNGIEAALWDLQGRFRNQPVHRLLGNTSEETLPCYASGGPSNYPPDRLEAKLSHYFSLGFKAAKIGAGCLQEGSIRSGAEDSSAAPEFEHKKFTQLRESFGSEIGLMLDAHMGNSPFGVWDYETARKVVEALEPHGLEFIEEPLPYTDPDAYVALCQVGKTPIAGGECLTTCEWDPYISHGAFDIGQPDASFTGGLLEFCRVADRLAENGRTIATHAWGAGPSLMQNIHAAFACSNTRILEIPPDYGPLHSEILVEPIKLINGRIAPPEAPGLGIVLPQALKEKFRFQPGSGECVSVPGKQLDS